MNVTRKFLVVFLFWSLSSLASSGKMQETENLPHAFEAGWQGQKVCELLYEDEAVRVGRCVFPPGIGHEKHFHRPHFGYVLTSATMRITDADGTEVTETTAGGSWETDAITVHEAVNIGQTTASYLIVEPKTSPAGTP